jgi:predicted permease
MPPMVTAGILAMSANLESEIAAGLVGYGLLFSFLTLPLIHFFI